MASTKHKANHNPRASLPKRFRPFYDQARVESALRYGAQQRGLGSLLEQLGHDYGIQAQAQKDAGQSLLGALQGADQQLTQTYSQAGLTPEVLAGIGNSPTGQRLAAELASNRANIQQQQLGAQAGQQYIQQHLADEYQQDVGKVRDQLIGLLGERGLFESQTLADLIGQDRSARHEANVALREQRHDDRQKLLDRQAKRERAFIGQGLLPDENAPGGLRPLPGGKADPNARPKKKPSKPTGADRDVQKDLRKAASWIKTLNGTVTKDAIDPRTGKPIMVRDPDSGKMVPKQVPETDPAKRRAVVAEVLTKGDRESGIPSITSAALDAALDMYYGGALSPATVRALHAAGVKIKFLPGARTETQRRRQQSRINRPNRPRPPRNAPGPYRQDRPT